jgi:hypothetical protein
MPRLLNFLLFALITLPFGCKKYPDDDYWITLRSPKNRIKGIKRMVSGIDPYDGYDILALYKEKFGSVYFDFTDQKAEGTGGYFVHVIDSSTNQHICTGYWRFGSEDVNTDQFFLVMNDNFIPGACYFPESNPYTSRLNFSTRIKKLTKDELITGKAKFIAYEP